MAGCPGGQRFAADRMLGRLARWLRILGHDVAYGPHLSGPTLVACARREGRVLLTRDTRLARRRELPPHVFLRSDRFRDQLREVAAAVPLDGAGVLTRCLDCNRRLEPIGRDAVEGHVPAFVLETAAHFERCPGCGRLYWPATHRAHVLRELEGLGIAAEGQA
jgi:uncharacterized protein